MDLVIEPGSFIVVRGRSGVGKTTLAKIVSLLLRPDSGRIYFRGEDITNKNDSYWSWIRLKYIGYIDQFFKLIPTFTILENVELPLALLGIDKNTRRNKALKLLSELGLKDKAHSYPSELSGGQRQRVAIARALIKDPILIVGDEPLSNLDEETSSIVLNIFRKIAREKNAGILLTTTDLYYEYNTNRDLILVNNKLVMR
ncbi:MAG: ABC transporter ATP-binding protein [Staphylothermus sp.]|nr:ABC transporter ATP-binding protein [Staphylothermus sp.]